jgi:hypothetical protein
MSLLISNHPRMTVVFIVSDRIKSYSLQEAMVTDSSQITHNLSHYYIPGTP